MKLRDDLLAYRIVGCAMKVHATLGCGFMESAYGDAMEVEFRKQGVLFEREQEIRIFYDDRPLGTHYRADFVCGNRTCIVELKALHSLGKLERAQAIHYLLATQAVSAVLLNFGAEKLQYDYFSKEELQRIGRTASSNVSTSAATALQATNIPRSVSGGFGHIEVEETNSDAFNSSAAASQATDIPCSVSEELGHIGVKPQKTDDSDSIPIASPMSQTSRSVSEGVGSIGVKAKISAALHAEEESRGVRILYAAESGSRAWGFASPDSDWDVRAIYVHPRDWYLSIAEKQADTFAAMGPDDIDLSAWELRKALRLFAKSNIPLLEWLGSPLVYIDRDGFGERLRALVPQFFDPRGAAWHHLSMQHSALADLSPDGSIRIKKLCYALRSALSVRWIVARASMPPVPFPELFAASDLASDARAAISDILAAKRDASERDLVPLPSVLAGIFAENESLVPSASFPQLDDKPFADLDIVFRKSLLGKEADNGV